MKRKILLGFCLLLAGFSYSQENIVDVFFETSFMVDSQGFYRFTGQGIRLAFDVKDENDNQVPASTLANYELILNTRENNDLNTATKGVDFEAITDLTLSIPTNSGDVDDTRTLTPLGDQIFEADEFFFIEVTTNDPNITLKNAVNGVVRFPIRIVDNELTNIELEVIQNGAEPDQKARLRMTSSFQNTPRSNETGAPLLFDVTLSGGDAVINEDYAPFVGQASIANGASEGEFEIDILNNDALAEGLESFNVTIAYAGDLNNETERVRLVNGGTIPVTITDDGDVDNMPFTVSATLTDAGVAPNYTIEEGQTFNLNFNANGVNGLTYNPEINITKDGLETTEDFTISGLDQTFTIRDVNPDGSISFTAVDDGLVESDEVYIITIASEDTNLYTIGDPISFQITIKDAIEESPQVAVRLFESFVSDTGEFLTAPYTLEEGDFPQIGFDVLNKNAADLAQYDVLISTRDGSATATSNDYSPINNVTTTITTVDSGYDSYDSFMTSINIRNDEELDETNETFFIDITPSNNTISLIDYSADPNGEVLNPGETLSLEIIIKNSNEYYGSQGTISFDTELRGDINQNTGTYTIDEGGTIELWIEAEELPNVEGFEFSYTLNIISESENDYTLVNGGLNRSTQVGPDIPDEKLNIRINLDTFTEPDESIKIQLQTTNEYMDWLEGDIDPISPDDPRTFLEYIIEINDIAPADGTIIASLENQDGTEGDVDDIITLRLTNADGSPFEAPENIIFPVVFGPADTNPAEPTDYIPQANEFIVMAGMSTATINIVLPDEEESEEDMEREFYKVTLQDPTDFDETVSLPPPLIAKILDDEGTFNVSITLQTPLEEEDATGNGCCTYYLGEEGQSLIFAFDAESGVPEGHKYKVELTYGGATYPEGANEAQLDEDYETVFEDKNQRIFTWEANRDNTLPDNRLAVKLILDDELDEGEAFNISFKPASGEKFSGSISRDIEIVDADPVSISTTIERASESPKKNAEMVVKLDNTINNRMTPLTIFYQVVSRGVANEADSLDFKPLSGSVDIPPKMGEAIITIEPIDDEIYELDESLTIELIDGPKYSLNEASDFANIIIESNDAADYTATIRSGEDNQSREADSNDFAEVIIELDQIPIADIEVEFKISDRTDSQNVIEGFGQDYIIYQEDKETIIPSSDRKVVFKANTDQSKRLFIKALPDEEDENNESVFLQLDFGVNYRPLSTTDAEVILVSATSDLSSFDPTSITVVAKNPRCPGEDQEGSIFMSNGSPFPFDVNVKGLDGSTYDTTARLDKNDSEDFTQTFEELPVGNYEITFSFTTEDIPEDAFPPRYTVQINAIPEMSAEEQGVNLKTRLGRFTVAGSETYTVEANGKTYIYDFGNSLEHVIEVPLDHGLNSVQISGDAACLGTIKKELLLNRIFIYPNPVEEFVSIISNTLVGHYKLQLFDMNGRLVHLEESTNQTNQTLLDVSQLQKGLYLGRITTAENDAIEFKLIKN